MTKLQASPGDSDSKRVHISRERAERIAMILELYACSDSASYLRDAPPMSDSNDEPACDPGQHEHAPGEINSKGFATCVKCGWRYQPDCLKEGK